MTLIRKKGIIEMANFIGLGGLVMNLIASLMIGYVRIFRSKKTIKKESRTDTPLCKNCFIFVWQNCKSCGIIAQNKNMWKLIRNHYPKETLQNIAHRFEIGSTDVQVQRVEGDIINYYYISTKLGS
jgi:hypothetical protein